MVEVDVSTRHCHKVGGACWEVEQWPGQQYGVRPAILSRAMGCVCAGMATFAHLQTTEHRVQIAFLNGWLVESIIFIVSTESHLISSVSSCCTPQELSYLGLLVYPRASFLHKRTSLLQVQHNSLLPQRRVELRWLMVLGVLLLSSHLIEAPWSSGTFQNEGKCEGDTTTRFGPWGVRGRVISACPVSY